MRDAAEVFRPVRVLAIGLEESKDVFQIPLDAMARIAAMDRGETLCFDHRDPAMVSQQATTAA